MLSVPLSETKRALLRIALPAVAGFLGLIAYELVNIFWIARLGTDSLAGVAAACHWLWMLESIMMATTVGCSTLVAQSVGAGDAASGHAAVRESAHLSLAVSASLAVAGWLAAPGILGWMGLSPAAHDAGVSYLRILLVLLPVLHLILLADGVFNAHGDTRTVVLLMTAALAVNAILDPILIFGWFGLPAFGPAGAALASACGWLVGLSLRAAFLRRRGYIPPLAAFLTPGTEFFSRIFHIGAPTAVSRIIWSSVYPLLTTLITRFGMSPLAGMTIGHRLESFAYFTCSGFSIATAAIVGQRMGRRDFAGAQEAAFEARTLVSWILIPMSLVFILFPEPLLSILSQDPETVAHGAAYLRRIGLLETFLGWELVFEGAFSGVGNTRPYMWISVPLTLGRYPAAYLFVAVFGFDINSIWWCIAVSTLLKGVLMSWAFRRTQGRALV